MRHLFGSCPPVLPALQRRGRFSHAEKKHPGGDQPVCDCSESAGGWDDAASVSLKVGMSEKKRNWIIFSKLLYPRKDI